MASIPRSLESSVPCCRRANELQSPFSRRKWFHCILLVDGRVLMAASAHPAPSRSQQEAHLWSLRACRCAGERRGGRHHLRVGHQEGAADDGGPHQAPPAHLPARRPPQPGTIHFSHLFLTSESIILRRAGYTKEMHRLFLFIFTTVLGMERQSCRIAVGIKLISAFAAGGRLPVAPYRPVHHGERDGRQRRWHHAHVAHQ